jgi:hypothetical protein
VTRRRERTEERLEQPMTVPAEERRPFVDRLLVDDRYP